MKSSQAIEKKGDDEYKVCQNCARVRKCLKLLELGDGATDGRAQDWLVRMIHKELSVVKGNCGYVGGFGSAGETPALQMDTAVARRAF